MQYLLHFEPPWKDDDTPARVRRSDIFGALSIGTLLLLVWFVVFGESLTLVRTSHFERSMIRYDGRSIGPIMNPVEFQVGRSGELESTDYTFDFKAYSMAAYDDLMQTASTNSGIRLELSSPGNIVMVIGYGGTAGYGIYSIASSIAPGTWHRLDVSVSRSKRIFIRYDDRVVVDVTDSYLGYEVSQIAFGTGFSKSRPFDGVIDNGSFTHDTYDRIPGAEAKIFYFEVCLLMLGIGFMLLGSNARLIRPSGRDR